MSQIQYVGSVQAASLLGINRSTLIRWVSAGKITPVGRLSDVPTGAHLFSRDDIEELAKARASPSSTAA